jgi:hypothetical protein
MSSYETAKTFLEAPNYALEDIYRSLDVIAKESDYIQTKAYENSKLLVKRNNAILYYDCTNFFFEIEREDALRQYGVSKEHRPNPIVQMAARSGRVSAESRRDSFLWGYSWTGMGFRWRFRRTQGR